jgi:predicted nucleic acid-binding protein
MILLDASVIIDFWRKPTPAATEVFRGREVCVCGPILAELMHGARREDELEDIRELVSGLPQLEIPEEIWPELGRNLFALRKAGLTVPFQDALLATVAIFRDLEIWTNDGHFEIMRRVLTGLRLFSLPPSPGNHHG